MQTVNFEINLTPKQKAVYDLYHDNEVKEIVLLFSRQSGKSTIAEILMMEAAITNSNANIIYISPLYSQGKKIYKEICNCLETTPFIKKKNSSDLIIELTNKSTIQFLTTQSPTSIRGNTASYLMVLDECAYMPETTPSGELMWANVIQPLAKTRRPKIMYISTPAGKQGFFYEKYLKSKSDEDSSIREVTATIYDDKFITEAELNDLKVETPPLAWEQEYMCKFLDSSLTAIPGFENCFEKSATVKNTDIVWGGLDFSSVGSDETILTFINEQNNVIQYNIEGSLDQKYKKTADIINSYPRLQLCYAEVNSIGEVMLNEILKQVKNKSKVEPFITTNDSKADMIGLLQTQVSDKTIHFNENDTELYKQFGVFTYQLSKTKKVTYAAKAGHHDDRVMSLAMAVKAKDDRKPFDVKSDVVFIRQRNMTIR